MRRWIAFAALLLAGSCRGGASPAQGKDMPQPAVRFETPRGPWVVLVEIARTGPEQARGLMFRRELPSDRGMLFVFEAPGFHGIWMKNCRFPIDILWLDEEHKIVHLAEAVPPCKAEPCDVYQPLSKAAYVVELNAGQARREKAALGAALDFTLPR